MKDIDKLLMALRTYMVLISTCLILFGCTLCDLNDDMGNTSETSISRSLSVDTLVIKKQIEISSSYSGSLLLDLKNYKNTLEEYLSIPLEKITQELDDNQIFLSTIRDSSVLDKLRLIGERKYGAIFNNEENGYAIGELAQIVFDADNGTFQLKILKDISVGEHYQLGACLQIANESKKIIFMFDVSVIDFNVSVDTLGRKNIVSANKVILYSEQLPDVLLSCVVSCIHPMEVFVASPNVAHIGSAIGSSAVVKPLFITEDDQFYVEANVEHPGCLQEKTIRITNNYTYAENYPYSVSFKYRGYIPLAHPVDGTEHIAFIIMR